MMPRPLVQMRTLEVPRSIPMSDGNNIIIRG